MKKIGIFIASFFVAASFIQAQNAQNMFTRKVGTFEVILLAEVQQSVNTNILIGATSEMIKQYAPDGTIRNAVNAFLIRTREKNILVDAGFGRHLFENLQTLGISPEEIDVVLLTHMHGDHIGGMLRDGKASFPNAEVYLTKNEHDYWLSNEAKNPLNARKVIEAYKDKLHLILPKEFGQKPADGMPAGFEAIAAYGHTPGHTAYLIESNKEKMLIWGDLTHAIAIQMPYPQVAVTYDVDPEQATNSRKKILEHVSKNNIPIAGMHISFPGMGKIVKEANNKGYSFIPSEINE